MSLTLYQRGATWWAKGRITYDGQHITDYQRRSTGTSSKSGAEHWVQCQTQDAIRGHLFGKEAVSSAAFTFADAVTHYPAKPKEAGYLIKVLPHLADLPCDDIAPDFVRSLGPLIAPQSATDTWKRQILAPVSAVINHAHDKRLCQSIRIKGYSAKERIAQDAARGKQSRAPRQAGSWAWIDSLRDNANAYVIAGLEFMFETGCRVSQMTALTPDDLDLQNRRVWVIAQKSHPAQWVDISDEMMVTLANLPARRPLKSRSRQKGSAKTFGYADRTGYTAALRKACKAAGAAYLSPHQAGRHGFYTELTVRQGLPAAEAARAGRWSGTALPNKIYAHGEGTDRAMRVAIRTNRVQDTAQNPDKTMTDKGKRA